MRVCDCATIPFPYRASLTSNGCAVCKLPPPFSLVQETGWRGKEIPGNDFGRQGCPSQPTHCSTGSSYFYVQDCVQMRLSLESPPWPTQPLARGNDAVVG